MELAGETGSWLETENGERISLKGPCTFGRSSGNTVVLSASKASRRHALINEQRGEFWLVDLGSTNGIEINGKRVTHPVKLEPGDNIQMPEACFSFRQMASTDKTGSSQDPHISRYEMTTVEIRIVKCWIFLADLQGFTALSQQLPADGLAPLVGKWMADCQDILVKQHGVLSKFLGDGFLAHWIARDVTAEQIAEACQEFRALQKSAPLPFRTVLHFGDVSFGGQSADASNTMLGQELNFAFRLEKVAAQMKLSSIFSEAATSYLRPHLELRSCGLQKVPGFEPERICFTSSE